MKFFNLSLAAAVAALVIGTGTVARANQVTDGTYIFSNTDGDTALDGSSVTFKNDSIVNWYLSDSAVQSPPPTDIPLTPSNSAISNFGLFAPDVWFFVIDGNNFSGANYYDEFKGQNNLFGPGVGGGTGSLYDGFGDPDGNWKLSTSVPDASSTFQLFVGALTALGTCKAFLRGRAASRS